MGEATTIGLALGGGAARGWAHIGVLEALAERDIQPHLVCGTSIGALVGGAYAMGQLSALADWARAVRRRDILSWLDVDLTSGGMIEGARFMDIYRERFGDPLIEELSMPFAAVATELKRGTEVWLREGSLAEAVRASIALPGVFAPSYHRERWLVDGGLVNPVPVSACRALGADVIIAVNLNDKLVGKRFREADRPLGLQGAGAEVDNELVQQMRESVGQWWERFRRLWGNGNQNPGLFDVLVTSIYIMQDRITRSRMAGDPPEVLISPRLLNVDFMEFDKAETAITEGRAAIERAGPLLDSVLG